MNTSENEILNDDEAYEEVLNAMANANHTHSEILELKQAKTKTTPIRSANLRKTENSKDL